MGGAAGPQTQIKDLPVAQRIEVFRRHAAPDKVVGADRVDADAGGLRRAGAQQNGGQRVLIAVQQLPSLVAGAAEQNAVHPLTNEKFKQPLDFAVPRAAAAKHHLIALLPGAGLNAQRERRVKGVGDVRQNQPQHIGAAGDEAPGRRFVR